MALIQYVVYNGMCTVVHSTNALLEYKIRYCQLGWVGVGFFCCGRFRLLTGLGRQIGWSDPTRPTLTKATFIESNN